MPDLVLYGGFAVVVSALLAVDLFVVHRESHAVSVKEAATWSGIWIGVAILFGLLVPRLHGDGGTEPMIQYFTGYVIEKSLSVDNVFLFILIFQTFAVPRELQHRVLFYGVLGAIIMRTILIFTGVALIERFEWLLYVFGAFLIYVAVKTWLHREESENIADSNIMKLIRRVLPATEDYRGQRFLVRENGRLLATPMLVVLILVEFTDLIFAVDSIPAVFAITRDPFIVLTSNVFAILGLRALYFLLAGVAARLHYLKAGLAVILGYVGVKLFTENIDAFPHPSPLQSLGVIVLILTVVIVMSLRRPVQPGEEVPSGVMPFGGEHHSPASVSDSTPPER